MKKLLVLGANPETIPIVEAAQKLGILCCVTDYNPDALAKKVADASYNVDGMDIEGLLNLVKQEKIDGVLVGVADALIDSYQKVCQGTGKICYATEEQVKYFTNKYFFKRKCEEFGIDGVPEYYVSIEPTQEELEQVEYPVIVKPVDACSGKGITLCKKAEEIKSAIEYAIAHSFTKRYIIEKYMTCSDLSIYYTFKNGKVLLSSLSDRFTSKEQGELSPVCQGDIFPSKYLDEFITNIHPKFCRMLQSLGVKDGILYISAFYENGKCYVYDPGFRLQGGGFHLIINEINGFDHRKMLVQLAMGEEFGDESVFEKNDPFIKGKAAGVVWYMLKSGTIAEIKGIDYIKNHSDIFYIIQRFQVGDTVEKEMIGTEGQVFLRLFMVSKNKEVLKKNMDNIRKKLFVIDENGNDMLLEPLNTDLID